MYSFVARIKRVYNFNSGDFVELLLWLPDGSFKTSLWVVAKNVREMVQTLETVWQFLGKLIYTYPVNPQFHAPVFAQEN